MRDKKARYLITTSDESTWKFDRPVIFLGEWCRIYSRKHIWENMDAIVAEPYGVDKTSKDKDNTQAREIEALIFPILCSSLNKFHKKQYSHRFWKILIGHWLRHHVDVSLNRVKTLEKCIQRYNISGTTFYKSDDFSLAADDFESSLMRLNDNRWNNILNEKILNLLQIKIPNINLISFSQYLSNSINKQSLSKTFFKWIVKSFGVLLSFFIKKNDALIISSYLPWLEEMKLHLALRQTPQIWINNKFKVSKKSNKAIREKLSKDLTFENKDNLFRIISLMVFELIPINFLEDFSNLVHFSNNQRWPKEPKFIFTSNNFYMDDVFKVWTASKVEMGIKYYVGQHGNNNGTMKTMFGVTEEVTSDKYLTWGWTDELSQHVPAFVFKTAGRAPKNYDSQGGLLLIQLKLNFRINTWDDTYEFIEYFENQQAFINGLDFRPKEKLTLRLHPAFRWFYWYEDYRWRDFDNSLKIDKSNRKINKLIAESRLVVHSYDSTGILETLSQNIPTLAFWQNDFHHIRDSAKPYYKLLIDAEIVHFTPESIAQKINQIWDDVDGWWQHPNVQDSRIKFCARYAKKNSDPINSLKEILLK